MIAGVLGSLELWVSMLALLHEGIRMLRAFDAPKTSYHGWSFISIILIGQEVRGLSISGDYYKQSAKRS